MTGKLSEYLVQEILANGSYGETCYKVKHKQTNSILIWKAYDCKTYTAEQLNNITNEVKSIKLLDNDNIIKYYEIIVYSPSHTLYIVTELYPENRMNDLIEKCKTQYLLFDEPFIWRCLYQIASSVKHLSTLNINILQKQINIDNLYVDNKFNIKIDGFNLYSLPNKSSCNSDMCKIGEILYEVCMLDKFSPCMKDIKFNHSADLQNMVNILIHNNGKQNGTCLLKPDIILHHPTVLINLLDDVKQMFATQPSCGVTTTNNDSAFESDESIHKLDTTVRKSLSTDDINNILSTPRNNIQSCQTPDILECKSIPTASYKETYFGSQLSPTIAALDLKIPGYVPRKESDHVKKWRSRLELCKEPQEVSEQALNQVWLKRLADLREREEALKQKEIEITKEKDKFKIQEDDKCNQELNDVCNSMAGITLQPSLVQKVFRDDGIVSRHDVKNDNVDDKRRCNRQSLSDGSVASDKSRTSIGRNKHRRSNSAKIKYRKKKTMTYKDMNSSLSADPGDTSMVQTSHKISSDKVPRPKSIHNMSRRKVHFSNRNNPFAEYDTVSSTVLTFFDIENLDASYEIPKQPPTGESLADRIAKFTYLDLEKMTNEKRALLEEIRKTPPKVNRATKPTLKSKVKAADNLKKFAPNEDESTKMNRIYLNDGDILKNPFNNDINRPASSLSKASGCSSRSANSRKSLSSISSLNRDDRKGNTPPFITVCKDERRKPIVMDIDIENELSAMDENKENSATPAPKLKKDSKRRSILGFKTPFKFRL